LGAPFCHIMTGNGQNNPPLSRCVASAINILTHRNKGTAKKEG
jgi:hypothetical protein